MHSFDFGLPFRAHGRRDPVIGKPTWQLGKVFARRHIKAGCVGECFVHGPSLGDNTQVSLQTGSVFLQRLCVCVVCALWISPCRNHVLNIHDNRATKPWDRHGVFVFGL